MILWQVEAGGRFIESQPYIDPDESSDPAHNYYQQPGGEDQVFADEGQLLESRGIRSSATHCTTTASKGLASWVWLPRRSGTVKRIAEIRESVGGEQPAVVHFHNTFPQISPAAYHAARAGGAAVVQGVPNYRLMCPTRSSCATDASARIALAKRSPGREWFTNATATAGRSLP